MTSNEIIELKNKVLAIKLKMIKIDKSSILRDNHLMYVYERLNTSINEALDCLDVLKKGLERRGK